MEEQLAQVCRRDKKSVKDYRENYFKELGFSNIVIERTPRSKHAHPDPDGRLPAAGRLQHDTEEPLVGADRDGAWLHRQRGIINGRRWQASACGCSSRAFAQPTDAGQTVSAFVLFNADQSQAELTLPEGERSG
jgi:hypothetical protein